MIQNEVKLITRQRNVILCNTFNLKQLVIFQYIVGYYYDCYLQQITTDKKTTRCYLHQIATDKYTTYCHLQQIATDNKTTRCYLQQIATDNYTTHCYLQQIATDNQTTHNNDNQVMQNGRRNLQQRNWSHKKLTFYPKNQSASPLLTITTRETIIKKYTNNHGNGFKARDS